MKRAVEHISVPIDLLLVDAVTGLDVDCQCLPIVHGDAKSYSIAAASILAKVSRDRLMEKYDEFYPEYHFAKHKGYGTKEHIALLKEFGPSDMHRKTFIKHFVS